MKIKKLISIYERLLPIYRKAYKGNVGYLKLIDLHLKFGLCCSSREIIKEDISSLFESDGYYSNIIGGHLYLYPKPTTGKDLITRIEFMEAEIKDLQKLLKKGYTHV